MNAPVQQAGVVHVRRDLSHDSQNAPVRKREKYLHLCLTKQIAPLVSAAGWLRGLLSIASLDLRLRLLICRSVQREGETLSLFSLTIMKILRLWILYAS